MTDNFANYIELIKLNGGLPEVNTKGNLDKYYVIELIRRGKDNPDTPAANYHFRNYYIYSWADLKKFEKEIKEICKLFRLRAYCSVNYKLMSQVSLDTLAECARRIAAHDFKKFYSIFETCSSKYSDRANNLWVVDVDEPQMGIMESLTDYINSMKSQFDRNVIFQMPTKSGVHLICKPFNLYDFNNSFHDFAKGIGKDIEIPDVKKNHLTLLYEDL